MGQMRSSTIFARGVWPSAACQIKAATGFRLKRVESTADIMTISSPSVVRRRYGCVLCNTPSSNELPGTLVRREFHFHHFHGGNKMHHRIENPFDEFFILREKQNMAHQGTNRVGTADRPKAILLALLEKADLLDRRRCVCARSSQLTSKGRAVGAVAVCDSPHVGDFVGENDRVGWRKLHGRGFSGAGDSGEQESARVANSARCVDLKTAFHRQQERMRDAQ